MGGSDLEGQAIGGELRLLRWLGGSASGGVYLAVQPGEDPARVAVKLVRADAAGAARTEQRWKAAARLKHPNLIRLFRTGACRLADEEYLYAVMEYADEDLSQVLRERPLAADEVRTMVLPVLDALEYLHGEGFVHGSLCPANVLAAGDQVKLASDSLHRTGEAWAHRSERAIYDAPERGSDGITPAADVWSLGVTLVEALTQRLPEWGPGTPPAPVLPGRLPEPFAEMVYRTLVRDAAHRWSVASLRACAEGQANAPPAGKTARNRVAWIAAGAAVLLAAAFGGYRWLRDGAEEVRPALVTEPEPQPAPAPAQARPSPSGRTAAPSITPAPATEPQPEETPEPPEGIVRQVLPDVPRAAQDTIQGSFAVEVRVTVDAAGDVADAALISPGPSRYFAALALDAARKWKFAPAPQDAESAERAWVLRFRFDRFSTRVAVSAPGP